MHAIALRADIALRRPGRLRPRRSPLTMVADPRQTPMESEALAAAIATIALRGDRAAFARLFSHFAPRVKAYGSRLGLAPELAEELAQDTLLAVWRRAASFDPGRAAASTWIFTIARHLRIDLARREGRDTSFADPADIAAPPPSPETELSALQDGARIAAALADLPAAQAKVVRLAYFSDQPHSEIAAGLGLPLGTVKSRLRLAVAALKDALGGAA